MFGPVSKDEMGAALAITAKTTAPGLDGHTTEAVKALGPRRLAWVATSCLQLGGLPEQWMNGRTTLIPKVDKLTRPGNFHPITITSVLTRVIHKVVSKRLGRAVPLPDQQKGFKPEERCAASLMILRALVRNAKTKPQLLHVAWLNFRKDFDSIGHPSLLAACRRWGMSADLIGYISNVYSNAATTILDCKTKINRGVLQGDPLFVNVCLDSALAELPRNVGVKLGSQSLNHLAFADDVALLASTKVDFQRNLACLSEAAGWLGVFLGVDKCA